MAGVRAQLRAWLEQTCPDLTMRHDVLLVLGEALGNAIEHGSEPYPGTTVSVEVFAGAEGISVTVSDTGRWSRDSSASRREAVRGRGLTLIHALSTRVQTVRTAHGTRVTMCHEWTGVQSGTTQVEEPTR